MVTSLARAQLSLLERATRQRSEKKEPQAGNGQRACALGSQGNSQACALYITFEAAETDACAVKGWDPRFVTGAGAHAKFRPQPLHGGGKIYLRVTSGKDAFVQRETCAFFQQEARLKAAIVGTHYSPFAVLNRHPFSNSLRPPPFTLRPRALPPPP